MSYLGSYLGGGSGVGSETPPEPPPTPIPVPIVFGAPEYFDHELRAVNRLCQQFRSGADE